jgi:toxin ParE1/3/4
MICPAYRVIRCPSARVAGAHELVAHENYIVYFDQDEQQCTVTFRAVVHVARQFPLQPKV